MHVPGMVPMGPGPFPGAVNKFDCLRAPGQDAGDGGGALVMMPHMPMVPPLFGGQGYGVYGVHAYAPSAQATSR